MRIVKLLASIIVLGIFAVYAQDFSEKFDATKMRERVKTLSGDDFEGRGPGSKGAKRSVDYIASELRSGGIKPANKGSFFQNVPMIGVKADPNTEMAVSGKDGATAIIKFGDEFVATTSAQKSEVSVDADLVFVGYGIDSPLYKWNDYGGSPDDYKGKILMILVNDPPATEAEPGLFGGKALTYYGRWTYKFEEAARHGAAGVILVHTTESAGYGWNVVRSSNGGWRYEIARAAGDKTPFLKIKSWVTNDAAVKILTTTGIDLNKLRADAQKRGFKPIKTGIKIKIGLKSELRTFDSPNVVGIIDGSDAKLKKEYVVFTSHWDHLGIGEPDASGDRIYNGAYDNASGVSAVLGIADVIAKLPKAQRPKRSIMFIFTTAEEQGLLGAEYFSQNPLIPLHRIAGNVNIDGVNFFGRVSDFMPLGAERSGIGAIAAEVARERSLTVESDARPEQGFFFRSDHFPFAKVGVPAVSLQHGDAFVKPLSAEAEEFFRQYTAKYYHQASDQYHEWWDAAAMIQNAEVGMAIAMKIANAANAPRYLETDEFSAADKKRLPR